MLGLQEYVIPALQELSLERQEDKSTSNQKIMYQTTGMTKQLYKQKDQTS